MSTNRRAAAALAAFIVLSPAVRAATCRMDEGVALFESRKFAEARRVFEPCATTDAKAAMYSGRAGLAERDFDRGVSFLEKAATLDPKSSEIQLWLGRAYGQQAAKASLFRQASLAGKAHKAFEQAVVLDPDSIDGRLSLIEFYLLAPGIMGGSVSKAREQAAEIRRRDVLKGYQAAGRIAEHEKKYDAAAAEYERASREFPQRKEPYLWRANLAAQQKQNAKAFDILESLLKAQPEQASAYFSIGRFGAISGERLDRAEECLKKYLQHEPTKDEPSLAAARYQLGVVYEKKGDREAARREWQQALALDPGHSGARDALAKK